MRRRMTRPRRTSAALAALLLALIVALTGCENTRDNNAGREGLPEEIGHLHYNVYISRLLNLEDVEDRGYFTGPEAPPGFVHFGVFMHVCNEEDDSEARLAASEFKIEDAQGNSFDPVTVENDNIWAYRARPLEYEACIPEEGTLASAGPTAGSLLIFELPLKALEDRPLNLIINAPPGESGTKTGRVELDV